MRTSAGSVPFRQGAEQLWFNEAQFESYRRLGLHIVQKIGYIAAAPGPGESAVEKFVLAAE